MSGQTGVVAKSTSGNALVTIGFCDEYRIMTFDIASTVAALGHGCSDAPLAGRTSD
ncbi:hypothetical protein ACFQL7_28070 [Halocatena marina]|uniref:Uncharacterized protein n=1 Tax=Halocatena marina TaxID=2934937 RepID=A0ABD5YWQ4_9EURY